MKKRENLKLLRSKDGGDLEVLIKARIEENYAELSENLFAKIKKVY